MSPPLPPELLAELNAPEPAASPGVSPDLLAQLNAADAPAPTAKPPLLDRAGAAVNSFFGRGDPKRPTIMQNPGREIGQQALKAGAFLVPGVGAPSMLASGALFGAGSSDAKDLSGFAKDTGAGAVSTLVGGKLLQGIGKGLLWVAGKGTEKAGLAAANAGAKAAEEKAAQLASEAGAKGAEVQKGSRYVENLMRLEQSMTPEQRALYASLQEAGVVPKLQQTVAQSTLEALPAQAARIAAKDAQLSATQAGAAEAVAQRTQQLLSPAEAKAQLAARLWRYGPPAVGSAIGTAVGGPMGTAVGFLAGAGSRPMVQSLRRMAKTPAVQKGIGETMEWLGNNPVSRGLAGTPAGVGTATGRPIDPALKAYLDALRVRVGGPAPVPADEESAR